jgi:excisionase family DNA binding protein
MRATREHFSVDVRMVNRSSGAPVWVSIDMEIDASGSSGHELWYGLMVDITERKRVEERLRTHIRVLDGLAGRLGPAMNLERMIYEVVRDLREATSASMSRFRMVGPSGKNLTSYTIDWTLGPPDGSNPAQSALEVSRSEIARNLLVEHVLRSGSSLRVSDLRGDERFSGERELHAAGARSALAVPVRDSVRIAAVLEIVATTPDAFGAGDRIFLEAAGSIAGLALARQGERWLTVPEVSEMLGVRPETVRRWIRSGDLVAAMPGGVRAGYRVDSAQLNAFVVQRQSSR